MRKVSVIFFAGSAGKFFLDHIGVSLEDFLSAAKVDPSLLAEASLDSFENFISCLASKKFWMMISL